MAAIFMSIVPIRMRARRSRWKTAAAASIVPAGRAWIVTRIPLSAFSVRISVCGIELSPVGVEAVRFATSMLLP
jgi:hypothetical protein